ncbi:class I SAM-dependent methyltransferase [Parvularcula sp. ZS-1/3]|uniref:Class I SAM-dependent methyltransferase n=1 Tax=Parvularcula mediterranea TaxID=2732508 RepID=A0A7Y3RK08_9PROT|nr:class I SAM-dependent methyltransferase [Parvularcula mediterranea]
MAACGSPEAEAPEPAEVLAPVETEAPAEAEGYSEEARREMLQAAADDADRPEDQKARDEFRNPVDTLLFFGVEPDDTVVEAWPGGGWYTQVLARYLAAGGGKLYAAGFDPESENERVQASLAAFQERFVDNADEFGEIEMSVLTSERQELAPAGTADVVLTFRNVHNFEMGGWSEAAFAGFFEALKPGGVLGVVDHRLPEEADKAMEKSSGYVKVSTVRQLAEEAGFVFDGSSEVNANPNDDADHPFGVWTLPPRSRTSGQDGTAPEGFDAEEYKAIGESDRMTLRFKKPIEPAEALLE